MSTTAMARTRRYETLVRIADDVVDDAKIVAAIRKVSMAELISETLRPILKQALADDAKRRMEERN